jgi:hypothetical protein
MAWSARIGIALVVLFVLSAAALAIYAGTLKPPHQTFQQVLPNDRFPG